MPNFRKSAFVNNEIYHIFNRSVDHKPIFTNKKDCLRALETIKYYQHSDLKYSFSAFNKLSLGERALEQKRLTETPKIVDICAYCLMPNHFHFLLEQLEEGGISKFISNITNSFTKYHNPKNDRSGPIFQGIFKEVRIETDEQLIHVSRYIHLNPLTAYIVELADIEQYEWSSYLEYMNPTDPNNICNTKPILDFFPSVEAYKSFVADQADYARQLDSIKHLALE